MTELKKVPPQNNAEIVTQAHQGTLTTREEERVQVWKDKRAKANMGFSYKLCKKKNDSRGGGISIGVDFSNRKNLSQLQQGEISRALQCAVSGSANDDYSCLFIAESTAALSESTRKADFIANAFSGAMLEMEPRDIIESQLCARLVILNSQANRFMNRAACSDNSKVVDLNINRATKLMRLHNETLEALNRYRRKGEQKMIIQHVNVNSGGQAVVAGEFTPGGGNVKKGKE